MRRWYLAVLTLALGLTSQGWSQQDGIEVLTRGTVHEAFASPGQGRLRQPGAFPKAPPPPLDEVPPDEKPDGDNVVWVPGYWAWDFDTQDYYWLSGCWRDAPPRHVWVPGSWQRIPEGWAWVRGFWNHENDDEVAYLPMPPESIERGPTTPGDAQSFYVPGCWIWREVKYVWRPGFWLRHRADWVWHPAYYIWTPAGCVFVEGYWDQPLHDRGLLFAPIRVDQRLLARRWSYEPRHVIHCDALMASLFVRPNGRQYVFGDFYGQTYQRSGYVPWIDFRVATNVVDVNFSFYRHGHAHLPRWEDNLRSLYVARYRGEIPPPPRTFVQQNNIVQKLNVDRSTNVTVNKTINLTNVQNVTVVAPITQINKTRVTALGQLGRPQGAEVEAKRVVKLETVNKQQQQQLRQYVTQQREFATRRNEVETRYKETKPTKPEEYKFDARLKMARPPTVGTRPPDRPQKALPPPPTIKAEERTKLPPRKGDKDKDKKDRK